MFTLLGVKLLLYYDACLMIKSGSGCRQSSHQQLRWVSKDLSSTWYDGILFCFGFQPDILSMAHVRCLTPSPALLFTSAMSLIMIISGSFTSIVNFFRYVCVAFLFASPVVLVFDIVLEVFSFNILLSLGYCFLTNIVEGRGGRKKRKSLGTSIFAMHECFCHYILNCMWLILILKLICNIQIIIKFSLFVLERKWMEELLNLYQYSLF